MIKKPPRLNSSTIRHSKSTALRSHLDFSTTNFQNSHNKVVMCNLNNSNHPQRYSRAHIQFVRLKCKPNNFKPEGLQKIVHNYVNYCA